MAQYAHKKMIHNQIIFFSKKGKKKRKKNNSRLPPVALKRRPGPAGQQHHMEMKARSGRRTAKGEKKGNKMWDDITPKNVYI
jgi:hypothetical protein